MLEVNIDCLIGQEGQLAPAGDPGIRSQYKSSTPASMTNAKWEMIYGKCPRFSPVPKVSLPVWR